MRTFYIIGAVSIILLIIGWLCIYIHVRKRTIIRDRELRRAIYMMEVQKLLFETHADASNLEKALEKCAEMLQAKQAFILTLEDGGKPHLYRYPALIHLQPAKFSKEKLFQQLPAIYRELKAQKSIVINAMDAVAEDLQKDIHFLKDPNLKSLMLVPVMDSEKKLQAVLGVSDFEKRYESAELLECVTSSFLMAILNYNSYQKIEEMAVIDMLTGLKNRNCYQQDIRKLAQQGHQSLCCIYMDVNGLHEMNNHLGHAAGDEMLRAVGASIRRNFGEEYSYRLGGDEFVTFCKDMSREEAQQRLKGFLRDMEEQHYHISVGSFWQDTSLQIDTMVSNAEKYMYEDKRRYYERKGDSGKAREMNRKLEETLLQKKDFEHFLSLIAHYFLGVYVVDLNTDRTRAIYKPSYFDEILNQNENRYRPSMKEYCRRFVKEEDQQKIRELLEYDNIQEDLSEQKVVHVKYTKVDGTRIRLRVFPSAEYCGERKETFWLFEEVSARYQ